MNGSSRRQRRGHKALIVHIDTGLYSFPICLSISKFASLVSGDHRLDIWTSNGKFLATILLGKGDSESFSAEGLRKAL
jgi:hypothetical protein